MRRTHSSWALTLPLIGALTAGAVTPAEAAIVAPRESSAQDTAQRPAWRDADGKLLPFTGDEQILEFLRTAEVVERVTLAKGATRPEKVLLVKDGVRAHAIFRSYRRSQERALDPVTGRPVYDDFTDSAISEVAAYELARMLELPFVPPTVRRVIDNREGTLQLWIENAMTASEHIERGHQPPHGDWWRGVLQTLAIFDNLLFNTDRHTGNLLIDDSWKVWFIDHTRAFQRRRHLRNPDSISFAERDLWHHLRELPDDQIRERLAPYLGGPEIMALLARRADLVHHIEGLIDERGERAVLFDYSYDLSHWRRR